MHAALVTVFQIHQSAPPSHDILVFLTGQEEIENMATKIRSVSKSPQCKNYLEVNLVLLTFNRMAQRLPPTPNISQCRHLSLFKHQQLLELVSQET